GISRARPRGQHFLGRAGRAVASGGPARIAATLPIPEPPGTARPRGRLLPANTRPSPVPAPPRPSLPRGAGAAAPSPPALALGLPPGARAALFRPRVRPVPPVAAPPGGRTHSGPSTAARFAGGSGQ